VFIRSFIYREINTFRLSKLSKINFAFSIYVPIRVQEMVYLKAIQKITPMNVSVSGTIDQTRIWKHLGGLQPPYPPLNPPMKYCVVITPVEQSLQPVDYAWWQKQHSLCYRSFTYAWVYCIGYFLRIFAFFALHFFKFIRHAFSNTCLVFDVAVQVCDCI